jgi:hypothetical protein
LPQFSQINMCQKQLVCAILVQYKHENDDRKFTKVNLPSWPRTSSPLSFRNSFLQLSIWAYVNNVTARMKQGKLLETGACKVVTQRNERSLKRQPFKEDMEPS